MTTADFTFSPGQQDAFTKVQTWLDHGDSQIFRLFGYAGTGKTAIAQRLAARYAPGEVLFAAYTGKAALTMQRAGCVPASTIHQLIYTPRTSEAKAKAERLIRELTDLIGNPERRAQIKAELVKLDKIIAKEELVFVRNEESVLKEARLLVLDECSMVADQIADDLMRFGVPILVLGDPAQLPPIKQEDASIFTTGAPDAMLTEIHRQAEHSPILKMATLAREGKPIPKQTYGTSRAITAYDVTEADLAEASQILCGKNDTRQKLNDRLRRIHGYTEDLVVGEKLICLRNDHGKGLLNGSLWRVLAVTDNYGGTVQAVVIDWDAEFNAAALGNPDQALRQTGALLVKFSLKQLRGEKVEFRELRGLSQFTYGYVITTHKAQGSQWDDVIVYNESRVFRESARNWLYTAVTRAAVRLTLVG